MGPAEKALQYEDHIGEKRQSKHSRKHQYASLHIKSPSFYRIVYSGVIEIHTRALILTYSFLICRLPMCKWVCVIDVGLAKTSFPCLKHLLLACRESFLKIKKDSGQAGMTKLQTHNHDAHPTYSNMEGSGGGRLFQTDPLPAVTVPSVHPGKR